MAAQLPEDQSRPQGDTIEVRRDLYPWPTLYGIWNNEPLQSFGNYEATRREIFRHPRDSNGLCKQMTQKEIGFTKAGRGLPKHYSSLSTSGKRRARAKIVNSRELPKSSTQIYHRDMSSFPDGTYLCARDEEIGVRSYCHTRLQHFDCGHTYRSLCPSCGLFWPADSYYRGCPLQRMIDLGSWEPECFVNFWPAACVLCHTAGQPRRTQPLDLELRLKQFEWHLWNQLYVIEFRGRVGSLGNLAMSSYPNITVTDLIMGFYPLIHDLTQRIRYILQKENEFWLGHTRNLSVDIEDMIEKMLHLMIEIINAKRK